MSYLKAGLYAEQWNLTEIEAFVERYSFATIIAYSHEHNAIFTSQVPVVFSRTPQYHEQQPDHQSKTSAAAISAQFCLSFHLSKHNMLCGLFQSENPPSVTILFNGPHAYISPSLYNPKPSNVPTWDFVTLKASGTPHTVDPETLHRLLSDTTDQYERHRPRPWKADSAKYGSMAAGIVGFEVRVDKYEAVAKLSQNRSSDELERIKRELELSAFENERELADKIIVPAAQSTHAATGSLVHDIAKTTILGAALGIIGLSALRFS